MDESKKNSEKVVTGGTETFSSLPSIVASDVGRYLIYVAPGAVSHIYLQPVNGPTTQTSVNSPESNQEVKK